MQVVTQENYYDQNGVLLLARGVMVSEALIKKLKQRNLLGLASFKSSQYSQAEQVHIITAELGERIDVRDTQLLEYSSQILSSIIFKSKEKPWWACVNSLSNYVGWLYSHSIDVAILSLMMAIEMKYTDKELWDLGLGAFLHDVGKLLIPKSIIQKASLPNEMDMVFIQQHCELGMSSIIPYSLPKESTDIILQHHERLDGSGYPWGLRGNTISRNAQIVMIADFVDEITSGRPHRPIYEIDTAMNVLKNDKEKFCQEYVMVLNKLLK